ncbi:hypothetical protein FA95DRAFT_1607386 [Auriscalpium vulgare]|uniref:Uncharacterized protein n=1 Tax=Auriscalpium vulgare TaxID=40419 RepID=A0ACB8RPL4_9AGAM|nr:hypothetical protein FA95DRAFT_1607386 [Auriscalpium vulgare]
MGDNKRSGASTDRSRKRYRSDGTPVWGKRSIDGPGVWVSCVKGKEKQTVGELYDVFEHLAAEMWPEDGAGDVTGRDLRGDDATGMVRDDEEEEEEEEDLEKQIAKELAAIKRPRKEQRFANCLTNTTCVVFIACKAPVDPVRLVLKHIENVRDTGVTHTRYTLRLTPVVNTCVANAPEIKSLFQRVLKSFTSEDAEPAYRYKIELRMRNHNTLSRQAVIDTIVECMPTEYTVDLEHAQVFVLVEVFKSVCGISIVKDYYELQKFNVMELANLKNGEGKFAEGGRVGANQQTRIREVKI